MIPEELVIDSGFILQSVIPDSRDKKYAADRVLEAISEGRSTAYVPWLFYAEIAAICTRKVRSGKLDHEIAKEFMQTLQNSSLHLILDMQPCEEIYMLAKKYGCGAYDALYVKIAQDKSLDVATVDGGMMQAAREPVGLGSRRLQID